MRGFSAFFDGDIYLHFVKFKWQARKSLARIDEDAVKKDRALEKKFTWSSRENCPSIGGTSMMVEKKLNGMVATEAVSLLKAIQSMERKERHNLRKSIACALPNSLQNVNYRAKPDDGVFVPFRRSRPIANHFTPSSDHVTHMHVHPTVFPRDELFTASPGL